MELQLEYIQYLNYVRSNSQSYTNIVWKDKFMGLGPRVTKSNGRKVSFSWTMRSNQAHLSKLISTNRTA